MIKAGVYLRVSSDSQQTASQETAIKEWLTQHPEYVVQYYTDQGLSGSTTRTKRPGLDQLIRDVDAGLISAVIVFRLDRLSRNAIDVLEILLSWTRRGVQFIAVDQPLFQQPNNPFMLTGLAMMAELAQVEKQVLVSRVKAGLAAARQRGVRLGAAPKVTDNQRVVIRALREQRVSYRDIARRVGLSVATVWNAVNK